MRVDLTDSGAYDLPRYGVAALELTFVFELQLAGDGGKRGVDIQNARHRHWLVRFESTPFGIRDDVFQNRDRQALRDAGALVDALVLARQERELLHHFANVVWHAHFDRRWPFEPGFLRGDGDALFEHRGVMRADLAADAVF